MIRVGQLAGAYLARQEQFPAKAGMDRIRRFLPPRSTLRFTALIVRRPGCAGGTLFPRASVFRDDAKAITHTAPDNTKRLSQLLREIACWKQARMLLCNCAEAPFETSVRTSFRVAPSANINRGRMRNRA